MNQLTKLAHALSINYQGENLIYNGVSINTRSLQPGEIFLAINGEQFDGHDFLAKAKEKGAVAAIIDKDIAVDMPVLKVDNTKLALGKIAAHHRQQYLCPTIALTGSCGKTTLKEILHTILSLQANTLATAGNFNNDIGVPLTLLRLKAEHQLAVIELAANHAGEIAYTTNLVQPDVAIINNIHPAHIEGFGSLEGIAQAKSEIFQGLTASGIAIINIDTPFTHTFKRAINDKRIISFSLNQTADFTATNISFDQYARSQFQLHTPLGSTDIKLQLAGEHNIANALAAAAACYAINVPLKQIKQGLEKCQAYSGRLELKPGLSGANIVDDTYNANLGSVTAALHMLANFRGKRIFILADLAELGDESVEHHQQIGVMTKQLAIDEFYTCGDLSKHAQKQFTGIGKHFANKTSLINFMKTQLDANTSILVKGSRSAKMEEVVEALVV